MNHLSDIIALCIGALLFSMVLAKYNVPVASYDGACILVGLILIVISFVSIYK